MKESNIAMMDLYFMDARSKLIDIAAFMDRVELAGESDDYRYREFVNALEALGLTGSSNRAEAILKMLSDPSREPCEKATAGPAVGAFNKG